MRAVFILLVALLVPAVTGAQELARVLGEPVERAGLPGAGQGGVPELAALYDRIWGAVSRHYVAENGLAATPEELAEFAAWHREFERRDRAQRARKLEELEGRLAADAAEGAERARLEEFRAVLQRLARADAERDGAPPPDPAAEAATNAQWIELWKLNQSLHVRYGGVVALTPFGPFAHGARVALLEDYERRELLTFGDPALRGRFYAPLHKPPAVAVDADQADFTPYWRRPIVPSYFPD